MLVSVHAAPQKASSRATSRPPNGRWPTSIRSLPSDWTDAEFLVVEFRSSTSQRFELGLDQRRRQRLQAHSSLRQCLGPRIDPAALLSPGPGRCGRTGLDGEPAAQQLLDQHRSRWARARCAMCARSASPCVIPRTPSTLEIRKVSLSKTDPGDAVLDGGTPLIDDFGQYVHADWPGKARSFAALHARVGPGRPHAGAQGRDPRLPLRRLRDRPTQGQRLLSRREDRRPLVVHRSRGLPLLVRGREWRGRRAAAHADRRPLEVVCQHSDRRRRFPAPGADRRIPCAIRCRSTPPICMQRFGRNWRGPSAQLTSRRMRAWGLNTAYGAALNDALPAGSTPRQPYVYPLARLAADRRRHHGPARCVFRRVRPARRCRGRAAARGRARTDPWMIGYFIGNEPPWPARESQLVDLVLAGPTSAIQQRFRSELAQRRHAGGRARRWCTRRSRAISRS